MIQRIQSLYFLVCMILIGSLLSGVDIFRFVHEKESYAMTVYGISKSSLQSKEILHQDTGFYYLWSIGLILFTFYTLMSYKTLEKQLKLARYNSFLYLISVLALVIFGASGGNNFFDGEGSRELGAGFSLIVVSFPFAYLAQLGVKRDKKFLESLNRLR